MSTSKLMKVTYYDPKSQIRLLCYADTVVWDTKPTPTLTALRFGGYPERVQGLADAIYGGATIEIEDGKDTYSLKTLTRQYRRELSHDGVYAEAMPAKVKPAKREQWVADRLSAGLQVLIANPTLVQTGLDLNAFTTLIFYDTGYKLFTLRQASRRSWRINQTAPRVEVYMFYYPLHWSLRAPVWRKSWAGS